MAETFSFSGPFVITGGLSYIDIPPGQQEYTTVGTYSWAAPVGVTSVSVVCIGGGGSGATGSLLGGLAKSGGGGAGGALIWKNNISVTPGQSYTVQVGSGGSVGSNGTPANGVAGVLSRFTTPTSNVVAGGGENGTSQAGGLGGNTFFNGAVVSNIIGGVNGLGGGRGGSGGTGVTGDNISSGHAAGGGGGGGYSGNGGNGGEGRPATEPPDSNGSAGGSNGSGGGGGGGGSGGAGGGGTGILGQGSSGLLDVYGGTGGSGGGTGTGLLAGGNGGQGGLYGAGGGGGTYYLYDSPSSPPRTGGIGRSGAVRIIWGYDRFFPSTNTTDV